MLRPVISLVFAAALAVPASAQVLPDLGGTVGGVVQPPLETVGRTTENLTRGTLETLRDARQSALQQLQRRHPDLIDRDRDGAYVIRNEVVAIAPTAEALAAARSEGFTERETVEGDALGLRMVVLVAPQGMSTRRAVDLLRSIDPNGAYDYNHLYAGSGPERGSIPKQARSRGGGGGARIGLIDSGADADHAAFAGARIEQRGFGGAAVVGTHGTAVGSILASAAPGVSLYVADVYGGRPTGGGATAIVAALNWLVQSRAAVINISLVGPQNRALEAAVAAAIARGHVIVAAVGNDGPAAAPLYPASYPGVVGVTGVDARNRALPEAGRGVQVDFAAPGSDFQAASTTGGYANVRGTSYASPIVAGLIARRVSAPTAGASERAQSELAHDALDLGSRGRDRTFGAGLVGQNLRGSGHMARR
jgi:subtilisin family serine protease